MLYLFQKRNLNIEMNKNSRNMKNKYITLLCIMFFILLSACTDKDYKLYDVKQKDSVFFEYKDKNDKEVTSIEYNFGYDIANEYIVEIPVKLMGMPSDKDRQISLKPVQDETTMKEGINFEIIESALPAREVSTNVKIKLLRDKDYELQNREVSLKLEIVENDDLRSVGQRFFNITYSDIRPALRPDWWDEDYGLPEYSFKAAQIFFKYFYDNVPKANIDVYKQIIADYGDYFVKAESLQGPMAIYGSFLIKYVLMPMYEDTKDQLDWGDNVPSLT